MLPLVGGRRQAHHPADSLSRLASGQKAGDYALDHARVDAFLLDENALIAHDLGDIADRRGLAGEDDNPHFLPKRIVLDGVEYIPTVDVGHDYVEDYCVVRTALGGGFAESLEGFLSAIGLDDFHAEVGKSLCDEVADRGLIVDNKDTPHGEAPPLTCDAALQPARSPFLFPLRDGLALIVLALAAGEGQLNLSVPAFVEI